jgi:hypothetical protein
MLSNSVILRNTLRANRLPTLTAGHNKRAVAHRHLSKVMYRDVPLRSLRRVGFSASLPRTQEFRAAQLARLGDRRRAIAHVQLAEKSDANVPSWSRR